MKKVKKLIVGSETTGKLLSEDGEQTLLKKGQKLTNEDIDGIPKKTEIHSSLTVNWREFLMSLLYMTLNSLLNDF
jgi:hypothetical protein